MLKALIVDDERLVRKGLISTMPWEKYEILIIGDVGNGRAALEFMEQQKVDLLFVDLTMPTMSGFELMKAVRAKYPKIWLVVLTCHQDFNYIQEAMRTGAIDYVVKTQLDKESMDDILDRIVKRIQFEKSNQASGALVTHSTAEEKAIWFVAGVHPRVVDDLYAELQRAGIHSPAALGDNLWSIPSTVQESVIIQFMNQTNACVFLKVYGHNQPSVSALRQYLFYAYEPHRKVYDVLRPTVQEDGHSNKYENMLDEIWFSLHWIYDENAWNSLTAWIEQTKPSLLQLQDLLSELLQVCHELLPSETLDTNEPPPPSLGTWWAFKACINELRSRIQVRMKQLDYFDDIIISIMKALHIMNGLQDFYVNRDMIASKINMSSGYFSECFKEITGKSFGEHMKTLQINRAKTLLETTTYPIYHIAERSGYKDDKYFSRIFRERVGIGPAEYRKLRERSGSNV
ncbi:response regulator transcription factor [Paenibacillus guangzhouensis]|uniref:response regulator transcription factor n=1 Tax=Paenibacillus guangzhouensis TaxID=1473112 RepID=UPI001266E336|nr:response regulator [Paenibacillus guangzhouensis]